MGVSLRDLRRQIKLEEESVEYSVLRYRKQLYGDGVRKPAPLSELPPGSRLLQLSMEPMIEALHAFKSKSGQGGRGRFQSTLKLFRLMSDDVIAFIVAKVIINSFTVPNGEYVQNTAIRIGQILVDQYEYELFKKQNPGYIHVVEQQMKYATAPHRKKVLTASQNRIGLKGLIGFSKEEKLAVGQRAIELFVGSTDLVEMVRVSSKGGKHTPYILQPKDVLVTWLTDAHSKCELLQPLYYPMVVPPKPWVAIDDGGFLAPNNKIKLVKTGNPKANTALKNRDMPAFYDAVNKLQSVPWRINKDVYNVMRTLWKTGGDMAGLPSSDLEELPAKQWDAEETPDPNILKAWKAKAAEVHNTRIRNRSKRISVGMKLSIAEKFLGESAIYFVWAADFRGRLYPIQGFINPQSDDSGRALLQFADGVPLTKEGAYWLAVHGANCFGADKASFPERYAWVKDNELDIQACAGDPLGYTWWTEADEPWQFLAFCFEWREWMHKGEDAVTHLPVSMDGSCNGLQHLSSLLLDGSAPVNLVPRAKPQDIYQEVADVLIEKVAHDAEEGNPYAKIWQGKITRKTTKRAVMCTPYGLKKYGLRAQLRGDLNKIKKDYLGMEGDDFEAIKYYSEKLHDAIGTVVKASREVMEWLHDVAKVAVKGNAPIQWTTPAGFLVHQEYVKDKMVRLATWFGETRLRLSYRDDKWGDIDSRRMVQGIAPNYIHSNDAAHLMFILNRWKGSITTVHDSIGTHASMIPALHKMIRETFVEMYSTNQLERFRKEVIAQLPKELQGEVPPTPQQGDLDISVVKDSPYFFA